MTWEYGVALESSAVARVRPVYGPFVDGAAVEHPVADVRRRPATVRNPTTDAPLARVLTGGPGLVGIAVAAARRAQPAWARLAGADRARILRRVARVVAARADELAVLETLGTGRLLRLTRDVDLPAAAAHLRSCAGWTDKLEYAGYGPDPRPVGVLGATVAGGTPLLTAVRQLAPALACGNAVVLVPDPDAPLTALVLAEAAAEAGLPAGVLNVLPGAGLSGDAAPVDAVLPSPRSARGVHVVHDDAPLDQAVDGIVETLGTDHRVLVAESVADELVELLAARVARLRVGDPLDANTDVGPVASRERRDRARALLAAADDHGRVYTSDGPLPERGLFVAPTLLADVAPTTPPARDEITGPIVPVLTFRTPAEAVASAGPVHTAAVWTNKGSRGLWTARRLRADVVWLDAVDRFDPALPAAALGPSLRA